MTLPNGPEGISPGPVQEQVSIIGADGGVPGLYGLNQPTVENLLKQMYVADNPAIQDPLTAVYEGLRRGISFGLAIIEAIVKTLVSGLNPGTLFLNIEQALVALQWVPQTITEHTEAIATLEDIGAAMRTTPAYVGDLQDMVTCPRADLVCVGLSQSKSQNVLASININDGDDIRNTVLPVYLPQIQTFATTGRIFYTPVVVDRKGKVDKLRWIVGSDSSIFAIDFYEMALCIFNPDSGNIEKVWSSGNIKDTTANTSTLAEVSVSMGIDQECSPGQILFVAHQQTGQTVLAQARSFAAKPQGDVARPADLAPLDGCCLVTGLYSQGIPSSIAASSLGRENRFTPWSAVSVVSGTTEDDDE